MRLKPEAVVNLAIVFACIAVGSNASVQLVHRLRSDNLSNGAKPPRKLAIAYAPGDSLPQLQGLDYTKSRRTVLLFVSSMCQFCTQSMPFYGRLMDVAGARPPGAVRVVAIATEPQNVVDEYLSRHQVRPDAVLIIRPNQLSVTGTPTILVIDERGRVQSTWLGLLPKAEEDAILSAVLNAT